MADACIEDGGAWSVTLQHDCVLLNAGPVRLLAIGRDEPLIESNRWMYQPNARGDQGLQHRRQLLDLAHRIGPIS